MKTAIIRTGMQGSRYAAMIASGNVKGMELAAMTRFREQYRELLITAIEKNTPVFQSADELFEAVEGRGNLIAQGAEGRNSLMISNAAYLSSWKHCTVSIPKQNTPEEEQFEKEFETLLREKQSS
jgi:hypothetical protein